MKIVIKTVALGDCPRIEVITRESGFESIPCLMAGTEEHNRLQADGNIALTTDYVFRGLSRSDSRVSVQGGLDLDFAITNTASIYIGSWGSDVDIKKGDNIHLLNLMSLLVLTEIF